MARPVPRTGGWSHASTRPPATGDFFEALWHFHTAQLRHPTVSWMTNTNMHRERTVSAGSHANTCEKGHQGLSRAPATIPQHPVGVGGSLAQSPTIKMIRSHSIKALLSTAACTGLAAIRCWENNYRCRKATGKLCPFLKQMHGSYKCTSTPTEAKKLLPASSDLRGKHAQHRTFFQRSDAKRGRIPDCKIS